jgi:hypothetical protein
MTLKMILKSAMFVPFCLALGAPAQSGDGHMKSLKDRVLDVLFPMKAPTSPFLTKLTMRFGDTDTQLVVLTYPVYPAHPGGRAEVIKYSITGTGNGNLSAFIARMVAQKPDLTAPEIADKLKVSVARFPIDYDALERSMKDLKALRISPVLSSRVAVDEYSEYDYWFDNGQEFLHYSITGPFKNAAQDQLVEWMIRFRASLPDLARASSAPEP